MRKLNPSQEKILSYLRECAQNGLPPSVREICNATGIRSTSTVHAHLKTLEEDGYISREAGLNRAIHIPGARVVQVPLVRQLRVTKPHFRTSDIEKYVAFTDATHHELQLFALNMPDDSMKTAGIFQNDIIIACDGDVIRQNDIVVAVPEKSGAVVRFFAQGDSEHMYLFSSNSSHAPVRLTNKNQIIGKVISLIRAF